MFQSKALRVAVTRHLLITTALVLLGVFGIMALALGYRWADAQDLAVIADTVFKASALVAGSLWALNRYYVQRSDIPQIRVDTDISRVSNVKLGQSFGDNDLLVYRIDVVNTGKALIGEYAQFIAFETLSLSDGIVQHEEFHRWPPVGLHPGGPIEPGSWSAINDALPLPRDVHVIRLYIEIHLKKDNLWTWHKTFNLQET